MRKIIVALAALAAIAGVSACGANTSSQGYHDGYNLGNADGIGGFKNQSPPDPTSCQAIVDKGLAWPDRGIPGDSKGDFLAGFMAGCQAAVAAAGGQ